MDTAITEALKELIENNQIPVLRQTSVNVLGKIGEEVFEVSEYLRKKGTDEKESNKFQLIALIQSGRNKTTFPISIELLASWIDSRDYKKKPPLDIELEIPDFFHDSILSAKKEELQETQLKNYVLVLREFIRLGILDVELSLRFSEALIQLDGSLSSKTVLAKVYSQANLVSDLGLYVKNLSKKILSEKNYPAFKFLQKEISKLRSIENSAIVIDLEPRIEKIIEQLKLKYPKQFTIAKKIEDFLNSYKEMLETIKK